MPEPNPALVWIPTATLFVMMLAMAMKLTPADFTRVLQSPRSLALGVLGQLVLLPLVAVAIARGLALSPPLAIGLLLIAACPGATVSNALCYYARGDTALSISLTAISSTLAFATVPAVLALGLRLLPDAGTVNDVTLPWWDTVGTVAATTALPVLLGMAFRMRNPELAERASTPLLAVASTLLLALTGSLALGLATSERDVGALFREAALSVALLLGTLAGIAHVGARALGLSDTHRRTLLLEIGLQNFNLALVLALGVLGDLRYAGAGIVYLPFMLAFGFAIVIAERRTASAEAASA